MSLRVWLAVAVCATGCTLDTAPLLSSQSPEEGPASTLPLPGDEGADEPAGSDDAQASGSAGADATPASAPAAGSGEPTDEASAGAPSDDEAAAGAGAAGEGAADPAAGDGSAGDGSAGAAGAGTAGGDPTDPTDPIDPPSDPLAGSGASPAPDAATPTPTPDRFQASCTDDGDCGSDEVCMQGNIGVVISYCAQVCAEDADCEPGPNGASAPVCTASPNGDRACRLPCDFAINETCPGDMVCFDIAPLFPIGTGTCGFQMP